jgi:hypothetical protein
MLFIPLYFSRELLRTWRWCGITAAGAIDSLRLNFREGFEGLMGVSLQLILAPLGLQDILLGVSLRGDPCNCSVFGQLSLTTLL